MKYLNFLFLFIILILLHFIVSPVFAATQGAADFKDLENYIADFLGMITTLAAVVVFVLLVFGGFKYLIAGGDPKAIEGARNTMTYAVLGLVVMIAAWIVMRFIESFTGVKVTVFSIKLP